MSPLASILLQLAATVPPPPAMTGPQTFSGPGYYCGGGFLVRLVQGDRVVFSPPAIDVALISLEIGGREIRAASGPFGAEGRIVARFAGGTVIQNEEEGRLHYEVSDGTPFVLTLSSDAFRGYRRDRWFFDRVNFESGAERGATCLEGQSAQ